MTFKICSIGCGDHANTVHGPSFRKYAEETPGVSLAACCDINESKARSFQERFGFEKYYCDIDTMLEAEKPDAVSLVSPVEYTMELALKIIEKGYPVIMEKPPGRDKEEVMKLVEAAEKYNVPNMVAFNRRYTPMIVELKKLIGANSKPEDIQNLRYDMYRVNRRDEDFGTTAIHGIDAVRSIMSSDYKSIRFHYQEFPQLGKGVKNIYMDCVMASGAVAHLNFCPVAGVVVERCTVNTFNNTYFLDTPMWKGYDDPGRLIHIQVGKVMSDISGDEICPGGAMFETGGFYMENKIFFDDIRAGKKPAGDLRTSVQSVEIQECITRMLPEYNA